MSYILLIIKLIGDKMKIDEYNKFMYQEVKSYLMGEHPLIEVKERRAFLYNDKKLEEHIKYELVKFTNAYINKKEEKGLIEIKPFNEWKPIKFNINNNDIKTIETKINKIKNPKLRFGFNGVLNLIKDENNLVYNSLYTRKEILKDLTTFKSLNGFKVSYINPTNLKKEYGFLATKKGCDKNHSKIIFIKHGLYVLKTINHDGISLKCFYIFNNVKTLIRPKKITKKLPKLDKFNLSSTEAWKTLKKNDNILFYGYCNNNGLDKSNRDLLKSIRKMAGGKTFSCYLEEVEEELMELEEEYASNPTIELKNGSIIPNYEIIEPLEEVRDKYLSLTEEHNSDNPETIIEDYY